MNELTAEQKKEAVRYMNKHEGSDFDTLTAALNDMFKVTLTKEYYCKLFFDSLY